MRNNPNVCACGYRYTKEEEPRHKLITRVVRPNNRFDGKRALEAVEVCERDIDHPSTLLGTMSIEEYDALRRPKPKAPPPGKSSVQMAAEYMETFKAAYERDKAREEFQKQKQAEEANKAVAQGE